MDTWRVEFGILGPLVLWNDGSEVPIGARQAAGAPGTAALATRRARPDRGPGGGSLAGPDGARDGGQGGAGVRLAAPQGPRRRECSRRGLPATRFVLEPDALDAARFEGLLRGPRLLADGEAAQAEEVVVEALGLWRGPALAEFRYEDFARDEIARLEGLRLVALETRLEADLALGRHAEAMPEIEALVREHPLRESLRRLLMLALYRAGRQADALAAYQDARTRWSRSSGSSRASRSGSSKRPSCATTAHSTSPTRQSMPCEPNRQRP